jgi:hypothetical protein
LHVTQAEKYLAYGGLTSYIFLMQAGDFYPLHFLNRMTDMGLNLFHLYTGTPLAELSALIDLGWLRQHGKYF